MPEPTKVCVKCGGAGVLPIEGDDLSVQQCICSYSRALKAHLGVEIATAPLITKSPLFESGAPGEPPKVDRTNENLFLKGYWRDLLTHFKWALGCKGPMFRFRMATDEKLKTIWLGQESYGQRAKGVRDGVTTYNSLADLVGSDVDLMIIRLGFLGHKNVAMPGILKEALMIREFACVPTWIVEVPTSIFGPGHFSYTEEVGAYIDDHFEILNLTRKESASKDDVPHGFSTSEVEVDEDGTVSLDSVAFKPSVTSSPEIMPKARFDRPPVSDSSEDSVLVGSGKPKFKKPAKRGGGPV